MQIPLCYNIFRIIILIGVYLNGRTTNEDRVLAEHEVKKHRARVIEKLSQNRKKNTIADRRSASLNHLKTP